jgi:hypothetical protein
MKKKISKLLSIPNYHVVILSSLFDIGISMQDPRVRSLKFWRPLTCSNTIEILESIV